MPTAPLQHVATLGIDIGKNSFHLIGLDARGAIVLRLKLSRAQLTQQLAICGRPPTRKKISAMV